MKILDCLKIDNLNHERVTFIRIDPEDLSGTLNEMLSILADLSWLEKFDEDFIKQSFLARAQPTIKRLEKDILESKDDKITGDVAEYIISELSREILINKLDYLDVPLAELLGRKIKGNPGFDFYTQNENEVILFGEAKYVAAQNAYGRGLTQVKRFIINRKDDADILLIRDFCSTAGLKNFNKGIKGYVVGFSVKDTSSETLINNIIHNSDYQDLLKYNELIFVAVNL